MKRNISFAHETPNIKIPTSFPCKQSIVPHFTRRIKKAAKTAYISLVVLSYIYSFLYTYILSSMVLVLVLVLLVVVVVGMCLCLWRAGVENFFSQFTPFRLPECNIGHLAKISSAKN